jgi:hypothetical protein
MSAFQRLHRLCPWKPHVKKGNVKDPRPLKVPQFVGNPGWILLSHEDNQPVAWFVDHRDTPVALPIVLDERLFSDTVIRVIQLKPSVFLACDIRYLNGINVYEKLSYESRRTLLESLLQECHHPDLTALLTYTEMSDDASIRGWEYYDTEPGTMGVFLPANE